jgi:hypothetical protein
MTKNAVQLTVPRLLSPPGAGEPSSIEPHAPAPEHSTASNVSEVAALDAR